MISALLGGLGELAKKPLNFIPALLGIALNTILVFLALDSLQTVFLDSVLAGGLPSVPLWNAPFYFLANNPWETATIVVVMVASLTISLLLVFAYSRIVSEKKAGVREGLSFALSRIWEAIALTIFAFIALFLYCVVGFLLFAASISLETAGIIAFLLFLAWLALGIYTFVKLAFTPLFMSIEGLNMKKALAASWKWSSGKFIPLVVFLLLLGIVAGIIAGAAGAVFDGLAATPDAADSAAAVGVLILILGLSLSNAYYNIAFSKFFIDSRHKWEMQVTK